MEPQQIPKGEIAFLHLTTLIHSQNGDTAFLNQPLHCIHMQIKRL